MADPEDGTVIQVGLGTTRLLGGGEWDFHAPTGKGQTVSLTLCNGDNGELNLVVKITINLNLVVSHQWFLGCIALQVMKWHCFFVCHFDRGNGFFLG